MPVLTIPLLGAFSATDQRGNSLAMGSRRAQALVIWLALHRDTPPPLQDFAALFKHEDVSSLARELRAALRFLPSNLLVGDSDAVRFRPGTVDIDTCLFDTLVSARSIPAMRHAAELYRCYLLEGYSSGIPAFDQW